MSSSLPLDVSIIIVNWNSGRFIPEAVESLHRSISGIQWELTVVENGSRKDPFTATQASVYPWLKYIHSSDNLGFSKANNLILNKILAGSIQTRYALLLNPDTQQIENSIASSVHYMDEHPEVGALGILHLNDDAKQSPQSSCFRFPRWQDDLAGMWRGQRHMPETLPGTYQNDPGQIPEQDVDWACGSFLLIRLECLQQTGPLNEDFFAFDEDIDWCQSAHEKGWKIRFWPGAKLIHKGSSSGPLMSDKALMNLRSRLSYHARHSGLLATTAIYLGLLTKLSLGLLKETFRFALGRSSLENLRSRFRRIFLLATLAPASRGA